MFVDVEGGKGTGGESIFGPVFEGIMLKRNFFYIHEYLKKSGPARGVGRSPWCWVFGYMGIPLYAPSGRA